MKKSNNTFPKNYMHLTLLLLFAALATLFFTRPVHAALNRQKVDGGMRIYGTKTVDYFDDEIEKVIGLTGEGDYTVNLSVTFPSVKDRPDSFTYTIDNYSYTVYTENSNTLTDSRTIRELELESDTILNIQMNYDIDYEDSCEVAVDFLIKELPKPTPAPPKLTLSSGSLPSLYPGDRDIFTLSIKDPSLGDYDNVDMDKVSVKIADSSIAKITKKDFWWNDKIDIYFKVMKAGSTKLSVTYKGVTVRKTITVRKTTFYVQPSASITLNGSRKTINFKVVTPAPKFSQLKTKLSGYTYYPSSGQTYFYVTFKNTSINWFLNQVSVKNNCQVFRVNIYSDSTALFWRGFQASLEAADPEIQKFSYPDNTEEVILLAEHLADFIPDNAHLIIASRNRFLMGNDILCLGKKIHHIGTEELKLISSDLLSYAHKSGIRITKKQAEELFAVSEGWFSVVYLNLRTYSQRGSLLDKYDDIYNMITEALIDPLSDSEKMFLTFLSPADEFTESMADFVTEIPDSHRILKQMTENNAFIIRLPEQRFRLHHMLQYCTVSLFRQLSSDRQKHCYDLYGQYFENQEDYLRALLFYEKAKHYSGWLRVIEKDAGVMLASVRPENVYYVLDKCPEKDLRSCPGSLLVLMRRLFTWQQVPLLY